MVNRANERVHTAVFDTDTVQIFQRLLLTKIDQLALDLRADYNRFSGKMVLRVVLNRGDSCRGTVAGRVECGGCEFGQPGAAVVDVAMVRTDEGLFGDVDKAVSSQSMACPAVPFTRAAR